MPEAEDDRQHLDLPGIVVPIVTVERSTASQWSDAPIVFDLQRHDTLVTARTQWNDLLAILLGTLGVPRFDLITH